MKVVIATPLYPPEPGGPSTYASMLEELLPVEDVQVTIVKFRDVRHLPPGIRHFMYMSNIRHAAKGADLIFALDPVSTGLPAIIASWLSGKPCVIKIVGDYAWEQGTQRFGVTQTLDEFVEKKFVSFAVGFLRIVQSFVAARAKAVIVPSNYLKKIILTWGVPEWKISVIYNAMRSESIGQLPNTVEHQPRPRIVTVGRLVPWKNMDKVIDAVKTIGQGSLTIVGDGPDRDLLHAHAEAVMRDTLFTGALSHPDALAVIADADVFVLNSSYEGLSHLLIEALSLGVPIVATNVGGNPELITSPNDGVLVPLGDTQMLSNAIALAATRKRKTKPEQAVVRFSPKTMAKATATLFKELLRI